MVKTYSIITFGCAANVADSERIAASYSARGYQKATDPQLADDVVINTCMIRQMAEDRVYGAVHNLALVKERRPLKIIITGCMVGMAIRDRSGKLLRMLKKRMPAVDEFLPIEEVGFDHAPLRTDTTRALVPISNGCNNFCTFCVVPFSRGREVSRPFDDIVSECQNLASQGYSHITLLGQNVNSYGADLVLGPGNIQAKRDLPGKRYFSHRRARAEEQVERFNSISNEEMIDSQKYLDMKPTYVRHLGRLRIPTLFPHLLRAVCGIAGIRTVDFLSSNPWDFSDELIHTIAGNPKISRQIHLPVQSGDNGILRKMNRWYTREEYLALVRKLRETIPGLTLSTDIIVGFSGETDEQFNRTVELCHDVAFSKAYVAMYSVRPMTAATNVMPDDVPLAVKKARWNVLEELINALNFRNRKS